MAVAVDIGLGRHLFARQPQAQQCGFGLLKLLVAVDPYKFERRLTHKFFVVTHYFFSAFAQQGRGYHEYQDKQSGNGNEKFQVTTVGP